MMNFIKRLIARFRYWRAVRAFNKTYSRMSRSIGEACAPVLVGVLDSIYEAMGLEYENRTKFALNMPRKHKRVRR